MEKYKFSKEELQEMKERIEVISNHLQTNEAEWVWNTHNKINNTNERKPCLCGKSAVHWRRAVETIREFIKKQ
jgi:hypothetical protein